METQIGSLASKMDANQAGMKARQEQMDVNQAKADASMKTNQEMLAKMEDMIEDNNEKFEVLRGTHLLDRCQTRRDEIHSKCPPREDG
jgi:dephospho-CoA kinase